MLKRPVARLWNSRRLMLLAGDATIFCTVVALTFLLRDAGGFGPAVILPFLPVFACMVITAYTAGLYEWRVIRDFVSLIGGLLVSTAACSLFAMAYFYLLSPYLSFSPRATLLVIVAGTHAGLLVWRRAALHATGFSLADLKILILGDERYSEHLRAAPDRRDKTGFRLVDGMAGDVDLVVVDRSWTDAHADESRLVLAAAIANFIPIVSITDFYESMSGRVSPQHANDLGWALDHVLPRSGSLYFKAKRVFDISVAAALLLVLAPAMLVVAVAIRLADRTSPIYGQMRVGYLGRPFRLWKFRTMRQDADSAGPFIQRTENGDSRVTRLGSFLRRLRIDELPQLWNVLKNDMSLVGPRPEWIKEVEILETAIPTYSLRYLVPPGITGWAQVYYRATDNPEDAVEKHNYDLYYLKHSSPALDCSILLKTIKRVFAKELRHPTIPAPWTSEPGSDPNIRFDVSSIVGRN